MPRQFTPTDKDDLIQEVREKPHVHDATSCGPGIYAVLKTGDYSVRVWAGLTERHGWSPVIYDPADGGHRVIFMPITEVPG